MTDKMPKRIAAWRFRPEKADEWISGGWSEDHDHKTEPYVREQDAAARLAAAEAERDRLREAQRAADEVVAASAYFATSFSGENTTRLLHAISRYSAARAALAPKEDGYDV